MPLVSVVLCARNSAATLDRQLAALARQELDAPYEVVLVDNGSIDETTTVAERWLTALPLRIVSEPVRGVNRARNRGVSDATATLVAFCDSDDEVDDAWLQQLCDALEHHDVVGGRLEHLTLSDSRAAFRDYPQSEDLPTAMGLPYAMGANLGIHRRVFDAIGGFDPVFDIGCDDVDFCLRAVRAGFTIGFAEHAVVHYRHRHELRAVARQRFSYGRGDERLARRHGQLGYAPYRVSQRLKIVLVRVARNLGHTNDLFRPATRARLVAMWAFVAGLVFELAADTYHDDRRVAEGPARSDVSSASKR